MKKVLIYIMKNIKIYLIEITMIPPSKKTINRQPEQGSISLLEEIQKKCNQSLTNSTCVNSNNISYETPSMNNLTSFYMKEDANKFMKKIDKLNLNFMILSDKYLKHQKEVEKVKDNLDQLLLDKELAKKYHHFLTMYSDNLAEPKYYKVPDEFSPDFDCYICLTNLIQNRFPVFHLGINLVIANKKVSNEIHYLPYVYWTEEFLKQY